MKSGKSPRKWSEKTKRQKIGEKEIRKWDVNSRKSKEKKKKQSIKPNCSRKFPQKNTMGTAITGKKFTE